MRRMRQCFLWQLVLIVLGIAIWLSPFTIYGAVNPSITINGHDAESAGDIVDQVNSALEDADITIFNGRGVKVPFEFLSGSKGESDYVIVVNMTEYNKFKAERQQQIMQITLSAIQNSGLSRSAMNKVYNEICALDEPTTSLVRQLNEDVRADFWGGYQLFKPFTGPIGVALGFFALFIFMVLAFSIMIDLAFINIPLFQAWILGIKNGATGKPILISLEAWNAVKEAESNTGGGSYTNPNWLFLRHKISQYVIVAICILYLTSGDLFGLIAGWIDYFRGFFK